MAESSRSLIEPARARIGETVLLRGWIYRLRTLRETTFVVLRDCSGEIQCVGATAALHGLRPKQDDTVEIQGMVLAEARAKGGSEVAIVRLSVLNPASHRLPFNSAGSIDTVSLDTQLEYRPLSLRTSRTRDIFTVRNALLGYFREYLGAHRFTEIITPKLVANGTEGGANLFGLDYFGRTAYLAQSPQLYKEHGVAAFERVFETGQVYRAEPHASSRHLTEYYSLDLEMGFIDGPEDVIELERDLLAFMFEQLAAEHGDVLRRCHAPPLPEIRNAPVWEFAECLARLRQDERATPTAHDLDPEAERLLCSLAREEAGAACVFVLGYPLSARPFYTSPRGTDGAAQSFDLLLNGVEVTTGGQRHHERAALEAAMKERGMKVGAFADHLRAFDLGMPPHGGLAIGLERLTAQLLGLGNVREAVMYPRDRYRLTP
ncbi:MAG TPA: aspartate--tRNA(Asn) ligase [Gammaproteobacteria bacterium]|nr:aspartate--tRNA(Asn) ligase [Gammaproteobacteria bacterium]